MRYMRVVAKFWLQLYKVQFSPTGVVVTMPCILVVDDDDAIVWRILGFWPR